jgi:hypothetical protein
MVVLYLVMTFSAPLESTLLSRPYRPDEVARNRQQLQKRNNGARLAITASEKLWFDDKTFTIDWTIDYNGPRHPFTILAPTLTFAVTDQTQLCIYSSDEYGSCQFAHIDAPFAWGVYKPSEECYATSVNEQPVSGKIQVKILEIDKELLRIRKYGLERNEKIYFQLREHARSRGDLINKSLDAWTGELWSNPVLVVIRK